MKVNPILDTTKHDVVASIDTFDEHSGEEPAGRSRIQLFCAAITACLKACGCWPTTTLVDKKDTSEIDDAEFELDWAMRISLPNDSEISDSVIVQIAHDTLGMLRIVSEALPESLQEGTLLLDKGSRLFREVLEKEKSAESSPIDRELFYKSLHLAYNDFIAFKHQLTVLPGSETIEELLDSIHEGFNTLINPENVQVKRDVVNVPMLVHQKVAALKKGVKAGVKLTTDLNLTERKWNLSSFHFRTIIHNLITNAMKFTDQGEISVTAEISEAQDLVLKVRDTGRGIPESELPNIFNKGEQIEESDKKKGFGFGLDICRRYAREMGGDITVKNIDPSLGTGAEFSVVFPYNSCGLDTTELISIVERCKCEKSHVLVVDDTGSALKVAMKQLSGDTQHAQGVDNYESSLVAIPEGNFSHLYLDQNLKDDLGTDLVKELRAMGHNVPITIVTADPEAIEESFRRKYDVDVKQKGQRL